MVSKEAPKAAHSMALDQSQPQRPAVSPAIPSLLVLRFQMADATEAVQEPVVEMAKEVLAGSMPSMPTSTLAGRRHH